MMRAALWFILTITSNIASSCINDGPPVYEKPLNGPYYLDANDEYKEMAISLQNKEIGVGVIKATVFAVGQTDDFIIAKQHPFDETGNLDKTKINYYIIPLKLKIAKAADKNYYGPLSLAEFNVKRQELGAGGIPFTIVFKELE